MENGCDGWEDIVFYGGMAYGVTPAEGWQKQKTGGKDLCRQDLYRQGLPIYRLKRALPYLKTEGTKHRAERLQVCYALFPEFSGKKLFGRGCRSWREADRKEILQKTVERAEREFGCREDILAWKKHLQGDTAWQAAGESEDMVPELPARVYAAYLYSLRPFDRVCITLPADHSSYLTEQLLELLLPYLPRIREIAYYGEKSNASEKLGDFFYQEYGTLMQTIRTVPKDVLWLDGNTLWNSALKFLDTRVKSGYNTEVN